jgi:minichromosome maintenance protein 10
VLHLAAGLPPSFVSSPPGRAFSIWKVTDLDQTCLSLFLFSNAHGDLWKEPEGTLVALFSPKVRAQTRLGS